MHQLLLAKKAVKFLRTLPKGYKEAMKQRLKELEITILPRDAIPLKGMEKCFRLRVGPFRVQYRFIEEDNSIFIYKISRRDETTYRG